MLMLPVRPNPFWITVAALPSKVVRITLRVMAILVVLFCALLLATRFLIFPQLENYRGRISAALAQQIGEPVELGRLAGGWDGWNPRLDIDNLRVVEATSETPLLVLPEIHLTVAWTSLLFAELRFKEAVFERPQLDVRRDVQGVLHVAGMAFAPGAGRELAPADWLLHQRRILIHDGSVTWRDEQRDAPTLELKHVEFRMENRFGRHRFGLTGAPPAEIAAPIDLRGDVTGGSLTAWRAASGRFYARLDYADLAAWGTWLPLPFAIKSGKGAVRVWLETADGEPRAGVADVLLVDFRATLAPELQQLSLARVDGRLGWRSDGGEREFFTEHLTFSGEGGAHFDPTDFKLVLREASNGQPPGGEMELSNLQLVPLMRVVANLPVPEGWRAELARYNPRGTLAQGRLQWQGDATAPQTFVASVRFADLGLAAQDGLPGFTGLSGNLSASDKGGTVSLQSRTLQVDLPGVFADPLDLDTLRGRIDWARDAGVLSVALNNIAFANAQVTATANGSYQSAPGGPGRIDLTAQIRRADVRDIYRYVPVSVAASVRDWLHRSLVSGTASDARLRLSGDLADFPFADGKKGQFLVTVKAQGVTLDYAEHWPALTDIDADVRFEGAHMSIDAQKGQVFDAALLPTKAEIANLHAANPLLSISTGAAGSTSAFFRFIAQSPVADWTEHVTEGAEATGSGKLALKIEVPLAKPADQRVTGQYTFSGNRLQLGAGVPVLSHVNGTLAFSGPQVQPSALTAEVLGGNAQFTLSSDADHFHVAGHGHADAAQVSVEYPQHPLARRLHGATDWQLVMDSGRDTASWALESGLDGLTVDLPPPMNKAPAESVPLQIEYRSGPGGGDSMVARYGRIGEFKLQHRRAASGATEADAVLVLGGAAAGPQRPGFWVRGRIDALDADGWLWSSGRSRGAGRRRTSACRCRRDSVHELDLFGRRLNDLRIDASHAADAWQIALDGRELAGSARWQEAGAERPNGRIVAHLQRFTVPAAAPQTAAKSPEAVTRSNTWPEIDIVSDSFLMHGRDLGKLQLTAQPIGSDLQIQRVELSDDDGKLSRAGLVARDRARSADHARCRARRGRRRALPGALRAARCRDRCGIEGQGPDRLGGRPGGVRLPHAVGCVQHPVRAGPVPQGRSRRRQAARRAVAAIAAAPPLARFPRPVRGGVRLRRGDR